MSNKKLVLYGAGANALCGIERAKEMGYDPFCFIDSAVSKAGMIIGGLAVKTPQDIIDEFGLPDLLFYITPNAPAKFEIIDFLVKKHKAAISQIVNYEEYAWENLCSSIAANNLVLETTGIALCCNVDENVVHPVMNYESLTPEETYTGFYRMRDDAIASIQDSLIQTHQRISLGCDKICANCKEIHGQFIAKNNGHIDSVAFGGGARCNFRCIYCGFTQQEAHNILSQEDCHHVINRLCAIADEFRKNGKIDKYTQVIIANGEPVLNPNLDQLLNTFYDNKVSIYTNASILSSAVCEKLRDGNSDLLVSIDAGTAETFRYVKGADCFEKVIKNIIEYSKHGKVNLKYILIPGVNSDDKNIEGFFSVAEKVRANVALSKDLRGKDVFQSNIGTIIAAAAQFVKNAQKHGLSYSFMNFSDEIKERVMKVVRE